MTSKIVDIRQSYVDGRFVPGEGQELVVDNPYTEEVIATFAGLSLSQMEEAVDAARRAFDSGVWSGLRREERVEAIRAMADYLEGRFDELAATLTAEAGATPTMIRTAQLSTPIEHMRSACDIYMSLPEEEHTPRPLSDVIAANRVAASVMCYEPIGVVTCISAYNFPIWTASWKFIPALLTGNTVILRPSPLTPISTLALGEAAEAIGMPPGVFNVVVEAGIEGGELLTSHPAVDCVSFTGSTTVGKAIQRQAADTIKRVILELGGKSVQIYLDEAVERAAMGCTGVFAAHAGQACVAPTRMLVPEDKKAEVLERIAGIAGHLSVGDPADPSTIIGPVISDAQRERCERYVAAAVEAGATVVYGGKRPADQQTGYFFEPTVLDVPDNSNPAAQDEIFGPVMCVLGYRDLDHAVEIANDSVYGLSAQVHGNDLDKAVAVARRIRSGAVMVNGGYSGAYASSGGYKQSGIGRERGVEGIRSFQQVKHLAVGNPA
jgi:acyl-CoA reductase-like NAD-dependent aldehyde dehydrogenase